MKIRKTKSLLYIFSSVMVLGLSLLSFDNAKPSSLTVENTTPTPKENAKDKNSSKNPTATPTVTPTPTPSIVDLNVAIEITKAEDEMGVILTEQITNYLKEKYSSPKTNVKEISNITCYYKQGLSYVDYIIYVSYDIKYIGSNVMIPTLEEYCVTMNGDNFMIRSEALNEEVKEALLRARKDCTSVRNLYIRETIRRFMNAKLACDEALLSELVTDSSYLNINDISTKTQYIERYENLQFLIRELPEEITEVDFIAYVANDVKIVNITTLAPGMDEYMITLNEENYPKIFYGKTSAITDEHRISSKTQEDFQTLYNNVIDRLADAMLSDPDLLEFIERINSATNSSTEQQ